MRRSDDGTALKVSICPSTCELRLPDACCCCKLQAGVVLTGLFTFVTSSGFVILLATRSIGQNAVNISDVRATLTYMIFILYGLLIPCSLLLIVGNLKEKYWIYVPWMICNIICVLLPILLIIWIFVEDHSTDRASHDLDIAIAVYHAINGTTSMWGEVCVLSHYKKMYQQKFLIHRERSRRRRYSDWFYPPPYTRNDRPHHPNRPNHQHRPTEHPTEQSGFNPENLDVVRRRPPLPPFLMARGRQIAQSVSTTIRRAFRRDRRERTENQGQAQGHTQGQDRWPGPPRPSQEENNDQNGNFMAGPHVTSINVDQNVHGAVGGVSGVTVHREPLRNLPPSIPIPGIEEDDMSEDSSSAITNTTQEMVSTLTSLGSRELSRFQHWRRSKDIRENSRKKTRTKNNSPERRTGEEENPGFDAGYDDRIVHSGPNLHQGVPPAGLRGPLPPDHEPSPPDPGLGPSSPRLHRNGDITTPPLHISEQDIDNLPPRYVGRAMRYADYFETNRYPFGSHDFGLTDQNFRPPKPYVPASQPKPQRQQKKGPRMPNNNPGPRMPLQMYQYGGYEAMDVFF